MKKSTVVISLILFLLIAAVGFYIWSKGQVTVSPVTSVQEVSMSPSNQESSSQPEDDPGGCINSDEYISDLGDGRFLYENKELAISFMYPEEWGNPSLSFQSEANDPFLVGTRCIVGFPSRKATMTTPALYISSNNFVFGAPTDAWGLDANRVDLAKSDEELIDQLSFPWTTAMKLKRRKISGSEGIVLEEEGVDPLYNENYHRFYYLFPRYDSEESQNLAITVLRHTDLQIFESFLDTVVFY